MIIALFSHDCTALPVGAAGDIWAAAKDIASTPGGGGGGGSGNSKLLPPVRETEGKKEVKSVK